MAARSQQWTMGRWTAGDGRYARETVVGGRQATRCACGTRDDGYAVDGERHGALATVDGGTVNGDGALTTMDGNGGRRRHAHDGGTANDERYARGTVGRWRGRRHERATANTRCDGERRRHVHGRWTMVGKTARVGGGQHTVRRRTATARSRATDGGTRGGRGDDSERHVRGTTGR